MPGPGCIYGGLIFFVFFRLSHSDQFADRISHRGKLFFIFCHYISGTHDRIVVQIEGVGGNGPASFRDCFQGVIKRPLLSVLNSTVPSAAKIWSYTAINPGKSDGALHGGLLAMDRRS